MWRCGAPGSVVACTVPLMPGATSLTRIKCRATRRRAAPASCSHGGPEADLLVLRAVRGLRQSAPGRRRCRSADAGIRAVPPRPAAQPERVKML